MKADMIFGRQLSLLVLACALSVSQGAQVVTLNGGNATASVNLGDPQYPQGMFNWVVGQDQLAQQWFWYRIGNNPESSVDTIGTPTLVMGGANQLTATYTHPLFSLRLDYTLGVGLPGSQTSTITEGVTVNNTSGQPLDFHFFQYSDFDLAGTPGGDNVLLDLGNALQAEGNVFLSEIIVESGVNPNANRLEAAVTPNTYTVLNDLDADMLNNIASAGPGNVTWAFQWDREIAVGGSFLLSKTKTLTVPEPSALAFVSLGLLLFALRKRPMA